MIKSTNKTQMHEQEAYDIALATALNLDNLIDKKTMNNPIANHIATFTAEFKNDMIELGEKLGSAANKIAALVLMKPELLKKTDSFDQLQYSGILIREPDLSHLFAPPSLPVSMPESAIEKAVKVNKKAEAARLKKQLKQELAWFQQFGRQGDGIVNAEIPATSTTNTDKAKRRLSVVSDHSQAA